MIEIQEERYFRLWELRMICSSPCQTPPSHHHPAQNSNIFWQCFRYFKNILQTMPKPPYGRQGLAGLWGKDTVRRVHFGMFSTSHLAPSALSLIPQPKRHITHAGPQLTSFGPNTWRHSLRCLDVSYFYIAMSNYAEPPSTLTKIKKSFKKSSLMSGSAKPGQNSNTF